LGGGPQAVPLLEECIVISNVVVVCTVGRRERAEVGAVVHAVGAIRVIVGVVGAAFHQYSESKSVMSEIPPSVQVPRQKQGFSRV
jgi:hypothetical protein